MTAPIRFLILVVGGWACVRAAMLAPWPAATGLAAQAAPRPRPAAAALEPAETEAAPVSFRATPVPVGGRLVRPAPPLARTSPTDRPPAPHLAVSFAPGLFLPQPLAPRPSGAAAAPPRPRPLARWAGTAWLLVRGEDSPSLAAAGLLGGSQAGFRLRYRPAAQLGLSARVSTPLRDRSGAEAALGLDWRPVAGVPVHLLAERRQAIGRNGRNAFALTLYGGVSERLARRLRLDAYGQAGIVGARSRDLFADGAARLGVPIGEVEIGASLSGGAQPGAARLDAGPQLTVRLPIAGESLRLTAEWRWRIAGEARPGSGPALTLTSDF